MIGPGGQQSNAPGLHSNVLTNPALGAGGGGGVIANPALGGGGAQGGYGGLGGVLAFLQGGINADQYQNMLAGHAGYGGYGVGGAHGAISGLSPWAARYMMQNLMTANAPQQTDLTGLTGDDLFKATLMNALNKAQPATYSLHSGVDQSFLQQLFGDQIDGHSAYRHGYNATGKAAKK